MVTIYQIWKAEIGTDINLRSKNNAFPLSAAGFPKDYRTYASQVAIYSCLMSIPEMSFMIVYI